MIIMGSGDCNIVPGHRKMKEPAHFESALKNSLQALGADLPEPLWKLIRWLENQGQCFTYSSNNEPFLSLDMVPTKDDLRSHIRFELPSNNMMRHWLDRDGYEREIIPFVRCGGDGSYFALWFPDASENPFFVFLGSEGECFVAAETVNDFIALITMGYFSIEGKDILAMSAQEEWEDPDWIDPTEVKAWAKENVAASYPKNGLELLPHTEENDPFIRFIGEVMNS